MRSRLLATIILAVVLAGAGLLATSPPAAADDTGPRTEFPLRIDDTGPYVDVVHKRLLWLGYPISASERAQTRIGPTTLRALHAFEDKFGYARTDAVTDRTWSRLKRIAGPVGMLPGECTDESPAICVDTRTKLVRLIEDGKVVLTTDARFGVLGQSTRRGSFRIHMRSKDHYSTLYHTSMPYALFFSGGQAIHYSPWFARDGYAGGSHGCVNLRDRAKAVELFDNAPIGTLVHIE